MTKLLFLGFGLLLLAGASSSTPDPTSSIVWQQVRRGLELGEYFPATKSEIGDSKITILRINPNVYSFRLLESARFKDQRRTAAQWCQQEKLIACINAGMYEPDGRSVGYMRSHQYRNNPTFNNDNCLLAFEPADSLQPGIKLIDRGCEADWEQQLHRYQSVVQSIRLIDCHQNNTWAQQPKKWSSAVWGIDKGRR